MSDLLQVADLEKAKKHDTFHSEVITGKAGGVAGGADIDYATNAVTGQAQKTLPKTLGDIDWSPVGKFVDGVTFTKTSDFALDGDNTQWIYTGAASFPVTVAAGFNPVGNADYQVIHVSSIQQLTGLTEPSDLDKAYSRDFTSHSEMINYTGHADGNKYAVTRDGFQFNYEVVTEATETPLFGGLFAKSIAQSSYNVINTDTVLIESEISQIGKTKKVVITGDSLSFNGFGYDPTWGVSGSAYATNNPFGMSSWAHMLRDLWVTSGFFQSIRKSRYYTNANTYLPQTFGSKNIGINQRALGFNFYGGKSLTIESNYTGSSALLISSQPSGNDVTFNINGVSKSTLTTTGHYKGYEYMVIPFSGDKAIIDTVVNPAGGDPNIIIYGVVPADTKVPKLTGKGGYTSTQILAEYSTLVAPYSPDIIFYIIGANDGVSGAPSVSGYNASVQSFINNAKAAKPDCVIVLISMPATSSFTEQRILEYVAAGRDLAIANNCSHIDLYSATKNLNPADWRFDNIHANRKGDTIWFNIFKSILFPSATIDIEKFNPVREAILGITINSMKRGSESHKFLVQTTATIPTISELNPSLSGIVKADYRAVGSESVCAIVPPKGYKVASIDNLIVSSAQNNIARVFQTLSAANNELSFRVTAITDNISIDPIGTGIYVMVTIERDMATL